MEWTTKDKELFKDLIRLEYDIDYMSSTEASKIWGISPRRVAKLCSENRIEGVTKIGNTWLIPKTKDKPKDRRRTAYA